MHKRSILKVPRRNKKIASGFLCFVVEEKGGVKTSEIQLPPKKKKKFHFNHIPYENSVGVGSDGQYRHIVKCNSLYHKVMRRGK